MNCAIGLIFLSLVLACAPSLAKESANDSVIGSEHRGRSMVPLGGVASGSTSLLHSVRLGSQVVDDVFVEYGPFVNDFSSTMKISLTSIGMKGRRTLVALVHGIGLFEGNDSLTFEVPPAARFFFAVKDFAEISASIMQPQHEADAKKFPSANDFSNPTGKYVGCIVRSYITEQSGEAVFSYLYEVGSMSDKSVRKDEINQLYPGLTQGNIPSSPGTCVEIN